MGSPNAPETVAALKKTLEEGVSSHRDGLGTTDAARMPNSDRLYQLRGVCGDVAGALEIANRSLEARIH